MSGSETNDFAFPYERYLHEVAPGLHGAQNAWMAEIAGSILLTELSFGISRAIEALPHAREGFKAAQALETETG